MAHDRDDLQFEQEWAAAGSAGDGQSCQRWCDASIQVRTEVVRGEKLFVVYRSDGDRAWIDTSAKGILSWVHENVRLPRLLH